MDNLLNYVIYNSIFENKIDFSIKPNMINQIPNDCFGAFVSVKRSKSQTLKEWPENIHGCIGNWSNDYKSKTKDELFEIMKNVGNNACNSDSRKSYFKPIYLDSQAYFEVDFMMLPIMSINSKTGIMSNGEVFKNENYGIIVENGSQKATYLPKVFSNMDWDTLKSKISNKASIKNNSSNIKFYGYKAKIYSSKIYNIIKFTKLHILNNFVDFNLKHYKEFIPYNINKNNVKIDKEQYVRNLATINDLLKIYNYNKNVKNLFPRIKNNLDYYLKIYFEDKQRMRQASSFLILALQNIDLNKNKETLSICNYLYDNIEVMDKSFELGEVCISLNEVCKMRTQLLNVQKNMYKEILNHTHDDSSIFRYNWEAKFLYSLYKTSTTNNVNSFILKHCNELYKRIIENFNLNNESETNYVAVTFEALSSLLFCIKDNNIKDKILYCYYLLQLKYNNDNGLYYFNGLQNARLDITGHVINGLFIF